MKEFLNLSNGVRREEHVTADIADFGRNVVDHHHIAMVPQSLYDRSRLVFTRTTRNSTLHAIPLLLVGLTHFGGLGSYAVIKSNTGRAVVQTR